MYLWIKYPLEPEILREIVGSVFMGRGVPEKHSKYIDYFVKFDYDDEEVQYRGEVYDYLKKNHINFRHRLASDPLLTPEQLSKLYHCLDEKYPNEYWIARAVLKGNVCRHPKLPNTIRELVVNDSSVEALAHQGLAGNHTLSFEHQKKLYHMYGTSHTHASLVQSVSETLAGNPATDHSILKSFCGRHSSIIASRSDITLELIEEMIRRKGQNDLNNFLLKVESNPNTPFEYYEKIFPLRSKQGTGASLFWAPFTHKYIRGMKYKYFRAEDFIDYVIYNIEQFLDAGLGDVVNLKKIRDFMYDQDKGHIRYMMRQS